MKSSGGNNPEKYLEDFVKIAKEHHQEPILIIKEGTITDPKLLTKIKELGIRLKDPSIPLEEVLR